jgi:hypothetical protein
MIVGGWILIGIGVLCFLIGVRSIFEVEILREEAGDIVLWGFRAPLNWLKRFGFALSAIKWVKQRKGNSVRNLRSEATHVAIEAAAWFATSAFFAAIGGVLISLGNTG